MKLPVSRPTIATAARERTRAAIGDRGPGQPVRTVTAGTPGHEPRRLNPLAVQCPVNRTRSRSPPPPAARASCPASCRKQANPVLAVTVLSGILPEAGLVKWPSERSLFVLPTVRLFKDLWVRCRATAALTDQRSTPHARRRGAIHGPRRRLTWLGTLAIPGWRRCPSRRCVVSPGLQ